MRVGACHCVVYHRAFVSNMVRAVQRGVEDNSYGMLWLVTYAFLLRMPSEACVFLARPLLHTLHLVPIGIANAQMQT